MPFRIEFVFVQIDLDGVKIDDFLFLCNSTINYETIQVYSIRNNPIYQKWSTTNTQWRAHDNDDGQDVNDVRIAKNVDAPMFQINWWCYISAQPFKRIYSVEAIKIE